MTKNGPKGICSLRPFILNTNNKILMQAAKIKAKKSAYNVLLPPKNEPSANINLIFPPPNAPGISANKKVFRRLKPFQPLH